MTQRSTEGVQAALDNNLSIPTPEIWALTIDEIGSVFDQSAEGKKHLEVCPRCLEGFRRYVQGLGATPADFGQADWTAVKPVLAGGPKATTYYTRKFNNYVTAKLFADLAAAFDAENAKKCRSLAKGEKSGPVRATVDLFLRPARQHLPDGRPQPGFLRLLPLRRQRFRLRDVQPRLADLAVGQLPVRCGPHPHTRDE